MGKKGEEKALIEAERRYWQALKDQDVATVVGLTDESCMVAGSQGVSRIDRKTLENMMKDATYTLDRFDLNDFDVRMVGTDVAIVGYKVHEDLTVDGQAVSLDAADTSTWVRRDGRWVCALHTESLLGDPFGRDRTRQPAGRSASSSPDRHASFP
jgi:hypothetical protein